MAGVGIQGAHAVAVINDDVVAVPVIEVLNRNNRSAVRGDDGLPLNARCSDVNAL